MFSSNLFKATYRRSEILCLSYIDSGEQLFCKVAAVYLSLINITGQILSLSSNSSLYIACTRLLNTYSYISILYLHKQSINNKRDGFENRGATKLSG